MLRQKLTRNLLTSLDNNLWFSWTQVLSVAMLGGIYSLLKYTFNKYLLQEDLF